MKNKCYIVVAIHLENKSRDKMKIKMEKSMNTETENHMMNDKKKQFPNWFLFTFGLNFICNKWVC